MDAERALIIGGELVAGEGDTIVDLNPATGQVHAEVRGASAAQVDAAVDAASEALAGPWGQADPFTRRRWMHALAAACQDIAVETGTSGSAEVGIPIGIAIGEAMAASDYLAHFAGYADTVSGRVLPTPIPGAHAYTLPEPVGVVAALTAWNSPSMLPAFKIGPALAAGCTVVLKTPELAPITPTYLGRAAIAAGLPPGVINVIPGGPDAGEALVTHDKVDKVSFTGGGAVGSRVAAAAAGAFKRVTLELGGKSANIVFDDADLDAAAVGACMAVFMMTGQQCVAGSRLFVHRSIFTDFVDRMAQEAKDWQPGDPADFQTRLGPLVSERALERVAALVDGARSRGATVHCGGERLGGDLAAGSFYAPTILSGLDHEDVACQEEIFGPVVTVLPFDDEDEVVRLANDTRYGLAGAVWTRDLDRANRVVRSVRTGTMWVNCYLVLTPDAPFGGFGASGIGREGGIEAVHDFTEWKTVHVAPERDAVRKVRPPCRTKLPHN